MLSSNFAVRVAQELKVSLSAFAAFGLAARLTAARAFVAERFVVMSFAIRPLALAV
jgi:hypothetical protein